MTYTARDVALERNGTLRTVKFKVWVSRCQVAAGFQLLAPFIYSNPFFGIFWVWLGRTSVISNISLFEDENPDFQPTFCCCSLGAQDVPASHIDYQPWNRITRNERKICTMELSKIWKWKRLHQICSPCCVLRHHHSSTNQTQSDPSVKDTMSVTRSTRCFLIWSGLHRINTDMRTNAKHVTSTNLQQCPKYSYSIPTSQTFQHLSSAKATANVIIVSCYWTVGILGCYGDAIKS